MAVWSRASCLSPLPWFESRLGHVSFQCLGFSGYFYDEFSGFLHHLQLASHDIASVAEKVMIINSKVTEILLKGQYFNSTEHKQSSY